MEYIGLSKLYFLFTIFLCNDIHDGIALGVFFSFLVFNLFGLLNYRMLYQKRINHMVYIT